MPSEAEMRCSNCGVLLNENEHGLCVACNNEPYGLR